MKTTPARRGAGMIAAGALVAGALAALPATAAHAAPSTTNYMCTAYGQSMDAKLAVDITAPATINTGIPLSLNGPVEVAWGDTWTNFVRGPAAVKFHTASATAPVLVNGVPLATPAKITFPAASLVVPATGPLVWPGTITLPAIPTTSGGDVEVKLGKADFAMNVSLVYSGHKPTDAAIPCAVSGAAPTIASVDVTPPGTLAPVAALKAAGKVAVGQRLTASGGTTNPASSVSYQWLVGGRAAGAGSAYVVKPADLGKAVAVRATAKRAGYVTRVTTVNVGKVAAGTLAVKGKAKITGKAKVGKKLKVKPGKAAGARVKYQWLKNGKRIKGAKGKTLKLKKSFKGKKISVKVTYTKVGYKTVTQKTKAVKVKK
ncbi:hypothetical protein KV100_11900 [Mumia sp. zg.B21]|uniref:hypothetical protein n=1 Tax=Mumia sp. zg.B21 TaxID=2855447 RepID=UPI001C6F026B|nr:hypothetical protein [Mumia sp. zg.B21]MBW9210361.1 hypothetical protein [Mumia sp. zg.B21]